jgi:dTDP-4-amino-4,6-dideoxygalactose transaminase
MNYWTGEEGRNFEREFAASTGCTHAIAVCNGTVALEIALHALGIGPGDEVIVPSRTFIASASCVIARGAIPIFADVDRYSQTISAATIERVLSARTKAIIAVHLAGWPCDMQPILELARAHGLKVVEDCAQAQGAQYHGSRVGSLADIAAFSFCQDKIVTTGGEGGMIVTNDTRLWEQAWSFKDHGKNYALANDWHPHYDFRWLHQSFGTNARLTEMQSAIGRVLLGKLDLQLELRRRNAEILTQEFENFPALRVSRPPQNVSHAYYKFYAFIRPDYLRDGWDRNRILAAVRAEGIPCFTGSCSEVYLEKAFCQSLRPAQRLNAARELGETSLMFLVHPTLSKEDMRDTVCALEKVLKVASSLSPCSASPSSMLGVGRAE